MPDIFNRTTDQFGGSFPADQARVTFPALTGGGSDSGLVMQNLTMQYQQQLTRLYEIGSPAVYYVGGRTDGNASVQRVIGPRAISAAFYSTYGDVCNARTNTLHFSATQGCGDAQGARAAYTAHFVVATAVGLNVGARDLLINETLNMMFSSLLYN